MVVTALSAKEYLTTMEVYFHFNLDDCLTKEIIDNRINEFILHKQQIQIVLISGFDGSTDNLFEYCLQQLEIRLLSSSLSSRSDDMPELTQFNIHGQQLNIDLSKAKLILLLAQKLQSIAPNLEEIEFFETKISTSALEYLCQTDKTIFSKLNFDDCDWMDEPCIHISGGHNDDEEEEEEEGVWNNFALFVYIRNEPIADLNEMKRLMESISKLEQQMNMELQRIKFTNVIFALETFEYTQQIIFDSKYYNKNRQCLVPIFIDYDTCSFVVVVDDEPKSTTTATDLELLDGTFTTRGDLYYFNSFVMIETKCLTQFLQVLRTLHVKEIHYQNFRIPIKFLHSLLSPLLVHTNHHHHHNDVLKVPSVTFDNCTFYNDTMTFPKIAKIIWKDYGKSLALDSMDHFRIQSQTQRQQQQQQQQQSRPISTACHLLTNCQTLFLPVTKLDLSNYPIDNQGLQTLCNTCFSMSNHIHFQSLYLNCTNLTCLHPLFTMLQYNTILTTLDMQTTNTKNKSISEAELHQLLFVIQNHNMTLTNIQFDNINVNDSISILWNQILFFARLNKLGRGKFLTTNLSDSIFSFILQNGNNDPSMIHWILKSLPHIFLPPIMQSHQRTSNNTSRKPASGHKRKMQFIS